MTNYVYDQTGVYAGSETDGIITPSMTNSGTILQEWMSGCPGMTSMIDGDVIYDMPTTIYPSDPLFGLALLECMEAKDWFIAEIKPIDEFMSPTANAIAKAGGNCGIGTGGFQHGNTCASGGKAARTFHIDGIGDVKKISDLPGSTKPILVEDTHGKKWVVKSGKGKEPQIKNEVEADNVYRAMGVAVPKSGLHKTANGEMVKVSEYIEGGETLSKWREGKTEHQIKMMNVEIGKHLALDSVLANWDVVGLSHDNVLIKDGVPYRIDNGGALLYRAQGEAKGTAFGNTVTEHMTLRDKSKNPTAASVFGDVTDAQLKEQINNIHVSKHKLLAQINNGETLGKVEARIDDLHKKMNGVKPQEKTDWGSHHVDMATKPAPTPVPPAPTPTPTAAIKSPGGKSGGHDVHTPEGIVAHIHANKGSVPFSDLYSDKLQAMNPNGVKDGVFFIPSFPTGEKSSLEKVAQLEKILPAGTIIKKKSITAKQVEEWKVKQKGMTPEEAAATTKPITPGKPKKKDVEPPATVPPPIPAPIPPPVVKAPPAPTAGSLDWAKKVTKDAFLNKSFPLDSGEHVLQKIAKNINDDPSKVASEVGKLTLEEKGKLKAHLGLKPGEAGTAQKLVEALQTQGVLQKPVSPPPAISVPTIPKPKSAGSNDAYWAPAKPPAGEHHDLTKYTPPIADNSPVKLLHSPVYDIGENQKWADSLSQGEKNAVSQWKGSATAIRHAVATGTATPGTTAGEFMSAITKSTPYEGVVYRGIHDKPHAGSTYATDVAAEIVKAGVGGTWSDPSPHCMSVNPYSGNEFSRGDVMFRITTKTGRPIQKSGGYGSTSPTAEMEVVGMPGTKYKIKAVAQNVQTSDSAVSHQYKTVKYLIDLEEI